jgi:hypothetical protein
VDSSSHEALPLNAPPPAPSQGMWARLEQVYPTLLPFAFCFPRTAFCLLHWKCRHDNLGRGACGATCP